MNAPVLQLAGVSKTFVSRRSGGEVVALSGIDLEAREGEFLCVVGPSGCGKSTMLALLGGFSRPTQGEARFRGEAIREPGPERGVMFQDYALFPWRTVMGNIEFGPYALGAGKADRRAQARQLARLVGLDGFEDRYPHELSGGMRQRCALARMLANNPTVWLMDEPLAAVDLQTRIILQDELLRLWGDGADAPRPTVLFVTHGIEEAALLADRIVVMSRRPGRIKATVDVELPRPRAAQRNSPALARLVDRVWNLIKDEAAQAIAEEAG